MQTHKNLIWYFNKQELGNWEDFVAQTTPYSVCADECPEDSYPMYCTKCFVAQGCDGQCGGMFTCDGESCQPMGHYDQIQLRLHRLCKREINGLGICYNKG